MDAPTVCNETLPFPNCFLFGAGRTTMRELQDCSREGTKMPQCTRGDISESLAEVTELDNGRFSRRERARGYEVLLDTCSLKEYGRKELLALWEGKRVLVSGGGAARQMFIKLVHILRGKEWGPVYEHSGAIDYYYATGPEEDVLQPSIPPAGVEEELLADPVLEVVFKYDDKQTEYRGAGAEEADVHIAVLSEWGEGGAESHDAYLEGALKHAKEAKARGFQFVLVTGPSPPANTTDPYMERLAGKAKGSNVVTLSAAQFARLLYFRPTGPNRYMCSTILPFPQPVGEGTLQKLRDLKRKGVVCRDHFNREWWKLLLNALEHGGAGHPHGESCREEEHVTLEWGGNCAHKDGKFTESECASDEASVVRSFCMYPEHCYMLGKGLQVVTKEEVCRPATKLPKCNWDMVTRDLAQVTRRDNGPFSWKKTAYGQVVRSATCDLQEYTRRDIINLFRGKKVLLTGDSLLRQVFKKFVAIMRGRMWDYNFELKGHQGYVYSMNETHDELIVEVPAGTEPIVDNQLFEAQFRWDPLPRETFNLSMVEARGVPDVHFASFGMWWRDDMTANDGYIKGAMEYARKHAERGYKYFFFPGPVRVSENGKAAPADAYRVRWLERVAGMVTESNTRVLSLTNYSKLGYFHPRDGTHYMCGKWDTARKSKDKSIAEIESQHKCHGHFNGNLWTIIFNALDGVI